MNKARIAQFSLQCTCGFEHPLLRKQAEIEKFVETLIRSDKITVDPKNVTLRAEDDLFNYEVKVSMYGTVLAVLNSVGISLTFERGTSAAAFKAAVEVFSRTFEAGPQTKTVDVIFATHGVFESPNGLDNYSSKFRNVELGIKTGGVILEAEGKTFIGDARIYVERSLGWDNAIFVSAKGFTTEAFDRNLIERMATRFQEITKSLQLELEMPEL